MGLLLEYFRERKRGDAIADDIVDAVLERARADNPGKFQTNTGKQWHQKGYYLRKYNSWSIPYVANNINCHRVVPRQDALSAEFSGCAMAFFHNPRRTESYVAHVCLMGKGEKGDCREMWKNYCEENSIDKPKIFRPKTIREGYVKNGIKVKWGLISSSLKFYDIVVTKRQESRDNLTFSFESIKEVYPKFQNWFGPKHLPISEDE